MSARTASCWARAPHARLSYPHHIASVLALVPCLAAQAVVTLTDTVYPTDTVTTHGTQRWQTARLVDAVSGAPIPGAEVLFVRESDHPLRGEMWWQLRAVADADGFVRRRDDDDAPDRQPWHWTIARAPGYGPTTNMGCVHEALLPLAPGQALPVRIRNWRGEPVAGALVGFCGGCGHTPDLVSARTDASGLALLPDVDARNHIADLYVEHAELDYGYDEFRWHPRQGPIDFHVENGVTSPGLLVDEAGKPVAGAFVGDRDVHRGPWTRTGADGTFRLFGSKRDCDLFVHVGDREICFERPPLPPFRLQLPAPNGERSQMVELPRPVRAEAQDVVLHVDDTKARALTNARVRWVGPMPGSERGAAGNTEGPVEVQLPPGRYEVFASGDDHAKTRATIDVRAGHDNEFVLVPTPLPTCLVRAVDLPESTTVQLRTATSQRDVTVEVASGRLVGIPNEPFWIVLAHARDQRRVFPFTPAQATTLGTLRVAWFAPTRIEGRLVDADGEPVAAEIDLLPIDDSVRTIERDAAMPSVSSSGAFSLASDHVGLAMLVLRTSAWPARVVPLVLPPRGDRVLVDVGTIVIGGPAKLVLHEHDGTPLRDATVTLVRPGWHDVRHAGPTFPVDADGNWHGPDPQAGDGIVVQVETVDGTPSDAPTQRLLCVHFPLRGDGPWTCRVPEGRIDLDVRDETGAPLAAAVFVGADHFWTKGAMQLRRVPTGPQRLFVAAAGRRSAVVEVEVPTRGAAAVAVTLPPR